MTKDRTKRSAFTLIELLVVMAIIAVLAALLAAGVMAWVSGQARRNSETQVKTVFNAFLRQWDAVKTDARKETLPTGVTDRTTWIRARLIESFPVTFAEITDVNYTAAPVNLIPAGRRKYRSNYKAMLDSRSAPAASQSKTESAACLYMALSLDRSGGAYTLDALKNFVKDSDSDGLLEFVDGWGEPLYFYRFVLGSSNSELANSQPSGLANPEDRFPVLVSSGANLKLGMNIPSSSNPLVQDMTVTSSLDADDNLISYKLK
jgi:prepilin-type N-terminal cleavage/methylation domain-containing protein